MAFKTTTVIRKTLLLTLLLTMGVTCLPTFASAVQDRMVPDAPGDRFETEEGTTPLTPLEERLIEQGLVNVRTLDPTLIVDLKYADPDNFMGRAVYGDFKRAYLRPAAAEKLARASEILRTRFPNLRILVGDALRPRSVQRKMWKLVVNTPQQRYVANPATGSMHNYGAAVDVTLYDAEAGNRLDMGTPLDHFGPLAQPALETTYLKTGELTQVQYNNRLILRKAMQDAGWHILRIEWWHFNAFPKNYVRRNYSIIE